MLATLLLSHLVWSNPFSDYPLVKGVVRKFNFETQKVTIRHEMIPNLDMPPVDHSGIEALQKLTERYARISKRVRLKHLSEDCRRLLDKAGPMVEVNIYEDPHYAVISDDLA